MKDDSKKKQICGYCPEDKCLLSCKICNPDKKSISSVNARGKNVA